MLTIDNIQGALAKLEYKEGWKFLAYDGRWEGHHIEITVVVPDAFNPGEMVTLDVHSMIPPFETERGFLYWLLWRIARIEVHEAREFFKVNGKVWDDPHAERANEDRP